MISAKSLTKYYGSKCAIHDISFNVEEGEVVGLLGPNAAGKTTTMRILTGYFPPTSGTAEIAGHDVLEDSLAVRKEIGYLPETVPLYTDMTVEELLAFSAGAKLMPFRKRQARIDEVILDCNLSEYADKEIKTLSKGYRQRVGLAQAIITSPKVLILDEPTVGMDPNQVIEIRTIIKKLAKTSTIILSSHILEEISKSCGKVIIMNHGKILAIDTPDNLSEKMELSDRLFFELSGDRDKAEELTKSMVGVRTCEITDRHLTEHDTFGIIATADKSADIRKKLVKSFVENDISVYQIKLEKMNLEEIFTAVVMKGDE